MRHCNLLRRNRTLLFRHDRNVWTLYILYRHLGIFEAFSAALTSSLHLRRVSILATHGPSGFKKAQGIFTNKNYSPLFYARPKERCNKFAVPYPYRVRTCNLKDAQEHGELYVRHRAREAIVQYIITSRLSTSKPLSTRGGKLAQSSPAKTAISARAAAEV